MGHVQTFELRTSDDYICMLFHWKRNDVAVKIRIIEFNWEQS